MSVFNVVKRDGIVVFSKNGQGLCELFPDDVDKAIDALNEYKNSIVSAELADLCKARVALGAQYMDLIRPGWCSRIDWSIFDMGNSDRCVAGQTGGYWTAIRSLNDGREVELGLAAGTQDNYDAYYRALEQAWRDVCGV